MQAMMITVFTLWRAAVFINIFATHWTGFTNVAESILFYCHLVLYTQED